MFRPTKKRPRKPAIIRTKDGENGDESPDETTIQRPSKKKKQKRTVVMSFDLHEAEPTIANKKPKKGMGFGGAPVLVEQQDEDGATTNSQNGAIHGAEAATLYGKDALSKLKSQQKYKPREEKEAPGVPNASSGDLPPGEPASTSNDDGTIPSYIPLSGKHENVVLAGDEAHDYESKQRLAPLQSTVEDSVLDAEQAEESSVWEAQVASRAGIRNTATRTRTAPMATIDTGSSNLSKLRDQVKSALTQLELQTEDVQNASARRKVELNQVQEELTRQEAELEQAGTSLEYYQMLREELASWVGALRELKTKMMPIQEALNKVERLGGNRWRNWQDDVVSILRGANLLDQVIGRQPALEDEQVTTVVDEFGRDVKSQFVLQRDKRVRQRRAIRNQRTVHDEDSDALFSDGEQAEMRDRRDALQEALQVAFGEVDDEYTKLSNLIAIFAKWAESHPEEYRQCFASMSLADLASVLVQADLCSAHHPLQWQMKNDEEELPWLYDLKSIAVSESTEEEDMPSYRMADKVLIPIFLELLDEGAYQIFSSKQSRSLAAFYWRICNMFPKENAVTRLLTDRIVKYLKEGLDHIAIPILKAKTPFQSLSEDVQEAVNYATTGQTRRIEKFVCNILTNWTLEAMAAPTLDFIASKYLFLLSSLQAQGCSQAASESFARVWKSLKATGWLNLSELMLQAAPIRAAAGVYGCK
jgi:hypothetical protein